MHACPKKKYYFIFGHACIDSGQGISGPEINKQKNENRHMYETNIKKLNEEKDNLKMKRDPLIFEN